jgi:hypothetical protein
MIMFLVNRSTMKTYNGASPGYTRSAPLFKTVRKEKMDHKKRYDDLKDGIWKIMEQLRELPRDEESGSWPDINAYSIWFTLFTLVTAKPEQYIKAIKDEQKRS